jgi:hypothetical protein
MMFIAMKCVMCLTKETDDVNVLCDTCKSILLHANMKMNGKLTDFLSFYDKH